MGGCKQCTQLDGMFNDELIVDNPTFVKQGDRVNIIATVNFGIGTYNNSILCFYENGTLVLTETMGSHILGGSETRTYSRIMGSSDLHYNVSLIMSDILGDWCDNFSVFTVTSLPPTYSCINNRCVVDPNSNDTYDMCVAKGCAPPTSTKYNCVAGVCQGPYATGTHDSLSACTASGCKAPPGGGACGTGKVSLFGQCYKTSDLAIVAVGVGALILLMRK